MGFVAICHKGEQEKGVEVAGPREAIIPRIASKWKPISMAVSG